MIWFALGVARVECLSKGNDCTICSGSKCDRNRKEGPNENSTISIFFNVGYTILCVPRFKIVMCCTIILKYWIINITITVYFITFTAVKTRFKIQYFLCTIQ